MSLLAEQVVEEWLNRRGFFTMRGVRVGTGEIDLLGVRFSGKKRECWHFEVQASVRPVSYICPAPAADRRKGTAPYSAKRRPTKIIRTAVAEWVQKKFEAEEKRKIRDTLCGGKWRYGLVLGNAKHQEEVDLIEAAGIEVIKLAEIIRQMEPKAKRRDGSDLVINQAGANDFIELLWAHKSLGK